MAQKTRANLTTQANIIKNETATAANTATRVGTMHVDSIDSDVNWLSDVVTDLTSNSDLKVPTVKAVVDGVVNSLTAGTNISLTGTATVPIINSLADRYKTSSVTSNSISNGAKTFTVDANLAYIPLQEVLIVFNASNHMHATVTSYSGTTLVVDVKTHTGSGTYTSWVINLDGVPIDAITGVGTVNRLAYFTAAQVIDDAAAITAARALKSDANGIPTHFDTATEPSLTELSYVKGVTSALQTQIDVVNITITTSISITTNTLDANSVNQHGHNTMIDNGASAINLECRTGTGSTANFCASYTKLGSAAITFTAGSGATLVQVDGTAVLNGAVGSTACLTRTGNTYYLQISNR